MAPGSSSSRRASGRLLLVIAAAVAPLFLSGCFLVEERHPPVLSNASVMGPLVPQGWGISPVAAFSDSGGDLAGARLILRNGAGATVLDLSGSITGAKGATSGTIWFDFTPPDLPCGPYSVEIWVWDSNEDTSNSVSVAFDVVAGFEETPRQSATGLTRPWIALGDIDGDGRLDVAALPELGSVVAVIRQSATGTLDPPQSVTIDGQGNHLAAGDVDSDGRAEILVTAAKAGAPAGEGARLLVLDVDPATGVPSVTTTILLGDDLEGAVRVADLDGDADLDALAGRGGAGGAHLVMLLQTATALGPPVEVPGVAPTALHRFAVGDGNGDGHLDLAAATGLTELSVLRGAAGGTFGTPELYPLDAEAGAVAAGDVDGDGTDDFVVTTPSGLRLLIGGVEGPPTLATAYWLEGGILADLDGNGTVELVHAHSDALTYAASHDGHFNWGFNFAWAVTPSEEIPRRALAVGDLTGDGQPDVVAATAGGTLIVYPHR